MEKKHSLCILVETVINEALPQVVPALKKAATPSCSE